MSSYIFIAYDVVKSFSPDPAQFLIYRTEEFPTIEAALRIYLNLFHDFPVLWIASC